MLFLVGLGLYDERDITLRGLEAIKGSARVYLEAYTSILGVDKEKLVRLPFSRLFGCLNCSKAVQEALYGRPLIVADRDMVETESDAILEGAKDVDVAFLVVGDPFGCLRLHH